MEEASDASVGEAADACSAAAADWSVAMDVNAATFSEAASRAAAAQATNADATAAAAEAANTVTTAKVAPAPAAAEASATAEAVDGVVCDICLQPVRFSANLIQHKLRYHAEHVEAHGAAPVGNGAGMLAPSWVVAPHGGTPALATCGAAGQFGQLVPGGEPRPRGGDANAARTAGANPSWADDGSGGQPQGGDDNSMLKDEQPATGTPALVHEYYKAFGDLERTEPVVPQQRGGRPSLFVTDELKAMRMFVLSAGGRGLSVKARAEYYHTTVLAERAALRMQRAAASVVRAVVSDESSSDQSSDSDSGTANPSAAPVPATMDNDRPNNLMDDKPRAAKDSHQSRPTRQKRRPKNNKEALHAALAMLASTAKPDDAKVFASLLSEDTGPVQGGHSAPTGGSAAAPSAQPESGGEPPANRSVGHEDGQAPHADGVAPTRTSKKKSSKRRRDVEALQEALSKLESMDGPVDSAFPKAAAYVSALKGEANRCLHEQQWRRTEIKSGTDTYLFYSRDVMIVALDAFMKATALCLRVKRRFAADNSVLRTDSLNGDLYMTEQESVDKLHANKTHNGRLLQVFTLGIQLFSDATLVSWNNGMSIVTHSTILDCPFTC